MAESLLALLKSLLLLPVLALLEVPFIRWSARVVIARRLSFGAAYLLALIAGATLVVAGALLGPALARLGGTAEVALGLAVSLALAGGLYGYFLTGAEGRSVGFLRGLAVVTLASVLFGFALLAIAFLVVGAAALWQHGMV